MTETLIHDFGVVPERGDSYEFLIGSGTGASCLLTGVVQTERGPRRTELAEIPAALWRKISARVVRELALDMHDEERLPKKAPTLKTGANRLSPLVGRELALLLWVLQEEGAAEQLEAILNGWRELAREERWWLYAKAASPGQRSGIGWRRGLFHALSEAAESRAAVSSLEKKNPLPGDCPSSSRRQRTSNKARKDQARYARPAAAVPAASNLKKRAVPTN
ncbi:MAG: DUF3780 domain-containing protein [Chromatiaceae bacterium]|nr:DUF3780 domain-containing protein [Chromatiaceae bacterium]